MSSETETLQARWAGLNEELATQEFREQLCIGLRELKDPRAHLFADAPDRVRKMRAELSQVEEKLIVQDAIAVARDFVAVHEFEADPAQDTGGQKAAILEKHGKFARIITVNP